VDLPGSADADTIRTYSAVKEDVLSWGTVRLRARADSRAQSPLRRNPNQCENESESTKQGGVASSHRRVGAETSKTRDVLLDCVERMMLAKGYESISYRALATEASVTASVVQHCFPALDQLFVAAITRYSERNVELLEKSLRTRSEDPLHALWGYSWDEATGALTAEFLALGNYRE
jgi:hypothetical protein